MHRSLAQRALVRCFAQCAEELPMTRKSYNFL